MKAFFLAIGLILLCGAAAAQREPAAHVAFNISAQPLGDALNEFAKQSGVQLLINDKDMPVGRNSPQVRGTLSAEEALQKILADTGLRYQFVTERTVAIRAKEMPEGAMQDEASTGGMKLQDAVVLAQGETEGARGADAPDSKDTSGTSGGEGGVSELEEIVVTGTHIRGVNNSTVPLIVLDKEYIDSTGISTAAGLIGSLPQNFSLASPSGVRVPGVSSSLVQGSSINLRGIGEGTTLVLLNGHRLPLGFSGGAVDISALPISALERVEVLTDGASAIYGSDAVGGVVNFVLRDDFEGAETRLRSGRADGGVNEYRVSQALGHAWDSGHGLLALEYYKRDLLPARERDFVPPASLVGSLYPQDENYSAMFSGRQSLTDAVGVFGDALYTQRDSFNRSGDVSINENYTVDNPQFIATLGLDWQLGGDWRVEASGSYARDKLEVVTDSATVDSVSATRFEIRGATLKADGSLWAAPGGKVRFAVGGDWRSESFQSSSVFSSFPVPVLRDNDQIVRGLFGELYIPLVGAANARAGVRALDVSLAGRFDEYSNFGSSFDPRFGLSWEALPGLRLRGSYGTSYVAPRLLDYNAGLNSAVAFSGFDPGVSGGTSYQLQVNGTDVGGLSAQESKNTTIGVELTPPSMTGLQLALNYYRIDYRDRIADAPLAPVILGNPASFGSLFIRNPTPAQVNAAIASGLLGLGFFGFVPNDPNFTPIPLANFDPATVQVIVDTRRRNLSVLDTSGLDFSLQYAFAARGADLDVGLTAVHILQLEQQTTAASAPIDTADTFINPPDWRVRGSFGWRRQGWAGNLFVNYTDSYTDNRAATPVAISSYTTVDARLAYDFGKRFTRGFMSGVTVSAGAQNLFDRDPPRAAVLNPLSDMGFDPTNANPMGRLIAVEASKVW